MGGGGGDPKDWEVLRMRVPQKRILHPPKVLSRGFFSHAGAEGGGFYSKKYIGGGGYSSIKMLGGGREDLTLKCCWGVGYSPKKTVRRGYYPITMLRVGDFSPPKDAEGR